MIDLRSDTVTQPTPAMLTAMASAPMGDDVYNDDPTAKALETLAAEVTGKAAALFVPSGTMANQLAIMGHTRPGNEIIVHRNSHIVQHEVGAAARLSQVNFHLVDSADGYIHSDQVQSAIREDNIHYPETGLLCLENALGDGRVVPLDIMGDTYQTAKQAGVPAHLDGARIFNAATALGVSVAQIAQHTDSLMFCLSKGLCAPVGSMLCGSSEFIARARKNRKLLGGGMRQIGGLCAAGILAIEEQSKHLHTDHANARYLAEQLATIPQVRIDTSRVQINMVFFDLPVDDTAFMAHLMAQGIKANGAYHGSYRLVTHGGVSRADIDHVVASIKAFVAQTAA